LLWQPVAQPLPQLVQLEQQVGTQHVGRQQVVGQ
jgi:hypothetical protein